MKKLLLVAIAVALHMGTMAPSVFAEASGVQIGASCTSAGQVCNVRPSHSFKVLAGVSYVMIIGASAEHCSDVSFRVLRANGTQIAATPFLAPGGESTVSLGRFAVSERVTVRIQAVGRRGGCNEGRLASWKGAIFDIQRR